MRKRLLIAGDSPEALEILPSLEANPLVEISAILTEDPATTRIRLHARDATLGARLSDRVTADTDAALATQGLVAVVDGNASPRVRTKLQAIRGLQVVTPGLARSLFGFGPVDALSRPDLLQFLQEILLSADLTRDQRSVLDLVLQVAVAATGADRGSLLLWDERLGVLRVAASLGIEEELLPKIRLAPGEGIAGHAFATRESVLLQGKADRHRWHILRERDDIGSAISAPLLHDARALGVLNLSHARDERLFGEQDVHFVEELARRGARILARADQIDRLLRDAHESRLEAALRRTLARADGLDDRHAACCALLRTNLGCAHVELWLHGSASELPLLRASTAPDRSAPARPGPDIVRRATESRRAVWLSGCGPDANLRYAALPLIDDGAAVGVLLLQGVLEAGDDVLEARWAHGAEALADGLRDALAASTLTRRAEAALAALAGRAGAPAPASLPDRRALRERLLVELARARTRGHRVLLIELEIPELPRIPGREDARTQKCALVEALRGTLRAFDLVACVGPQRFAVLVPEPEEDTPYLLARLHRALRDVLDRGIEPLRQDGGTQPLVTMGYATFPDDGRDLESLETRAAQPRVEGSLHTRG